MGRQGQAARQAGLIENQRAPRQLRRLADLRQIVVEKVLDALVDRTQAIGQPPAELALARQDRLHQAGNGRAVRVGGVRQAQQGQAEIDGSVQILWSEGRAGRPDDGFAQRSQAIGDGSRQGLDFPVGALAASRQVLTRIRASQATQFAGRVHLTCDRHLGCAEVRLRRVCNAAHQKAHIDRLPGLAGHPLIKLLVGQPMGQVRGVGHQVAGTLAWAGACLGVPEGIAGCGLDRRRIGLDVGAGMAHGRQIRQRRNRGKQQDGKGTDNGSHGMAP
jgi:hypothetical protein